MVNDITGINEQEIDKLVLEVTGCVDEIKASFCKIDELILGTERWYKSESGITFRNKYLSQVKPSFSTITNSLLSYNDDLIKVKSKIKDFNQSLSNKITVNSDDLVDDYSRYEEL